jgi:hypothetical protein
MLKPELTLKSVPPRLFVALVFRCTKIAEVGG